MSHVFILLIRYTKDINYYQKELDGLRSKKESYMSDPEACPHVLKKQVIRVCILKIIFTFLG